MISLSALADLIGKGTASEEIHAAAVQEECLEQETEISTRCELEILLLEDQPREISWVLASSH